MKKFLIVAACLVIVVLIAVVLFVRSHIRWLAKQSPAGVWRISRGGETITLQFDGGPKEGTYKQLLESSEGTVREFGHWHSHMMKLQMLILATDVKSHPRFGQDTEYRISYVGPDSIRISGPDRPDLTYERAPEGVLLDFDKDVEQPDEPGENQRNSD